LDAPGPVSAARYQPTTAAEVAPAHTARFRTGAGRAGQAFGAYFSEDGGSCALGAAYEGAYWLPHDASSVRPRLYRLFDCLENVRRRCPVAGQRLERLLILSPFVLRSVDPPIASIHGQTVLDVRPSRLQF
jgi:hypothetical protein